MADNEKWINDTALLFYQIFSVDYEDAAFLSKLLAGGGGNSTLCSTWTHLNGRFVKYRISKDAYELLLKKLGDEAKDMIRLEKGTVFVNKKVYKNHAKWFADNAKGAENREKAGKFFHFDHNPSNKKVLELLNKKIKEHKNEDGFLKELAEYIKTVQTIDLITIYEDDKRTSTDLANPDGPLSSAERDKLLGTEFYDLVDEKPKKK